MNLERFSVDFNCMTEADLVIASKKRAPRTLAIGDRVLAFDAEGNECEACVASMGERTVRLALDGDTWTDAQDRGSALKRLGQQ